MAQHVHSLKRNFRFYILCQNDKDLPGVLPFFKIIFLKIGFFGFHLVSLCQQINLIKLNRLNYLTVRNAGNIFIMSYLPLSQYQGK